MSYVFAFVAFGAMILSTIEQIKEVINSLMDETTWGIWIDED